MYKKLILLTFLVLLLALVGNASAATCWFYGGGLTSGDWDVAGNWYGGVPTSADTANLNTGGVTCLVNSSQTAVCDILYLPDYTSGSGICYLDMTGGDITLSNNFVMGRWSSTNDQGTLDLSGGTITVGGEFHVGGKHVSASAGGIGTVNMTGGTIDVAGALNVPVNTATGTVNLGGGTIEANSISMDANGLIDIGGGSLIIDGNVVSTVNSYAANGWITAGGGDANLSVSYSAGTNQTTITATGETIWFYPSASSANWDLASSWTDGRVPNFADTANLTQVSKTCVIDSNTEPNGAKCKILWLPNYQTGAGDVELVMSGSTLTVIENFEMGHWVEANDSGLLTMSGGTANIGGDLLVGAKKTGASAGGIGTINMTGGTIDIAGGLKVPSGDTGTSGTVNLNGGTIEANSITMDSNGLIDITAGALIIDGNVISTINTYASNDWIKANGDTDDALLKIDYNITNSNRTTVAAYGWVTGVVISCSASGQTVTVSYDVNSLQEVTAFALDVSVDNGAVIESASNFNSDYWVYPGSIDVNQTTEQIDDYGSAVCDGNLPGTLGGIDTNGITVEMAALYVGQANAPSQSGTLFKFTVDTACTVTITENYVRGIVMRDGSEITPTLSGCTVD